jgi:hypothetical protein
MHYLPHRTWLGHSNYCCRRGYEAPHTSSCVHACVKRHFCRADILEIWDCSTELWIWGYHSGGCEDFFLLSYIACSVWKVYPRFKGTVHFQGLKAEDGALYSSETSADLQFFTYVT